MSLLNDRGTSSSEELYNWCQILIIQWATLKSEQKKNRWGYRHIEQGLLIGESISVLW